MKTINEAATAYAVKRHTDHIAFEPDRAESEVSFTAGVQFAQRWISVKDGPSKDFDYFYLTKTELRKGVYEYAAGKYSGITGVFLTAGNCSYRADYWRPIELKYE